MRPEPDGSWRCQVCASSFSREFFDWLMGRLALIKRNDRVEARRLAL